MTLPERLLALRSASALSQQELGAQGIIPAPGWVKLEGGTRSPSEKFLNKLVDWLVSNGHVKKSAAPALREELLTLKYLRSPSKFVREMAMAHASSLPNGVAMVAEDPAARKPKRPRGRPRIVRK